MKKIILLVACLIPAGASALHAAPRQDPGTQSWPGIERVDAQPLLLQIERLREALQYIGAPLSAEQITGLEMLAEETDDRLVTAGVQALLDPLCIAAVEIDRDRIRAVAAAGEHKIVQQGWRNSLVKVANRGGVTTRLGVSSPNARPLANTPPDQVASRWMSLSMFNGRPLQPDLSGLPLEYRIIQIYSNEAGPREGTLNFDIDLPVAESDRVVRRWRFESGTDGWEAANDCTVGHDDGSMLVTSEGNDPYLQTAVSAAAGEMVVKFRVEMETQAVAQIFWWTKNRPRADGDHLVSVSLKPGAHEYQATIPVDDELVGLRIDPMSQPGTVRFQWIDLVRAGENNSGGATVRMQFRAQPSFPVRFAITDKEGVPAVAGFEIRDSLGRTYPEQSKRLAPDLFFHPQIYRADGDAIYLPTGQYTVHCQRGPHSIPQTVDLVVSDRIANDTDNKISYQVRRWFDPTEYGWWGGDHHIHAAGCLHYVNPTEGILPRDMLLQTMGEDLNVGCCLNWGPSFDFQKQFFTGRVADESLYPYLLRYDVEVSGFGSHVSGHLNLLRLREQIYPGGDSKHHWPTLGLNTLRWAKQQGGICGPAHSANGLTNYVGRLENAEDGPNGLPHFNIPRFDGIGACEYVVDITHRVPGPDGSEVPAVDFISTMDTPRKDEFNMWYHTLNCGFRVRASGETDFPCISGQRVGMGRVYVHVPGELNYDDWIQGVQDGRSYVSDGFAHIIDFEAKIESTEEFLPVGTADSELRDATATKIQCRATCSVVDPETRTATDDAPSRTVELVVNGYPVQQTNIPADGKPHRVDFTAEIDSSSWVTIRMLPHAHSNPFFVIIDDQPIRTSEASARWFLRCVEQCWNEKQRTYAAEEQAEARQAYDHARMVYQQILKECTE
jgi:hypothetical protein